MPVTKVYSKILLSAIVYVLHFTNSAANTNIFVGWVDDYRGNIACFKLERNRKPTNVNLFTPLFEGDYIYVENNASCRHASLKIDRVDSSPIIVYADSPYNFDHNKSTPKSNGKLAGAFQLA